MQCKFVLFDWEIILDLSCVKLNGFAYFKPMFHFYTPWKRHKTFGFLTFLRGIEMEHWIKLS